MLITFPWHALCLKGSLRKRNSKKYVFPKIEERSKISPGGFQESHGLIWVISLRLSHWFQRCSPLLRIHAIVFFFLSIYFESLKAATFFIAGWLSSLASDESAAHLSSTKWKNMELNYKSTRQRSLPLLPIRQAARSRAAGTLNGSLFAFPVVPELLIYQRHLSSAMV